MAQIDMAAVQQLLECDPVWTAYALADLQPEFAPVCAWTIGTDKVDRAVALVFTGLEIPTLFLSGPAYAAADAVAQIPALPEQVYITVREEHIPVVDRHWDFSRDTRPMWRLALPARDRTPASRGARLGAAHGGGQRPSCGRSTATAARSRPTPFRPIRLTTASSGASPMTTALLAAGGTHIVNWELGVGAIGNMYTRPDSRGRATRRCRPGRHRQHAACRRRQQHRAQRGPAQRTGPAYL
ncbi:MAG: hypothetical protein R2854_30520 [Caldilineaceae bacterium]